MNQTQKRLQIINLAISIGDSETVRLQTLKLTPLMTDPRIEKIVKGLQSENYAQTQPLIIDYIENPPEEIIRRTQEEEERALIEEFDLFKVENDHDKTSQDTADTISFDSFLKIDETVETDTLSPDTETSDVSERKIPQATKQKTEESLSHPSSNNLDNISVDLTSDWEILTSDIDNEEETHNALFELKPIRNEIRTYPPIAYIDQKFQTAVSHYRPHHLPTAYDEEFKRLSNQIALEGYTETIVEEYVDKIFALRDEGKLAEAAALLLLLASTESPYARYILARERYKGELIQADPKEAFDMLYKLAEEENHPEAMCDLAQFYETGTETKKDPQRALSLYRAAMKAGISRAQEHYLRLHGILRNPLKRLFRS